MRAAVHAMTVMTLVAATLLLAPSPRSVLAAAGDRGPCDTRSLADLTGDSVSGPVAPYTPVTEGRNAHDKGAGEAVGSGRDLLHKKACHRRRCAAFKTPIDFRCWWLCIIPSASLQRTSRKPTPPL